MAMVSFNLKEHKLLKLILQIFRKRKAKPQTAAGTVWQADLANLAQRYGDQKKTTCEVEKAETAQLKQLCDQARDLGTNSDDTTDRVVVRKIKRTSDTTAVDLKAWWGQSVATWDPSVDGKNLDSIEQVRRPRQSKWFE